MMKFVVSWKQNNKLLLPLGKTAHIADPNKDLFIGLRFCLYEYKEWNKGQVLFHGKEYILCLEEASDVF